jgi:hypothetical protein
MMKKVMFVVVSLLLVSYCFALESAPSNKVGYVKLSVAGGTGNAYTSFGLPFVFWDVPTGNVPTYGVESRKPSDIFGTQPYCGTTSLNSDRVVRTDVGRYAYRLQPSCTWTNSLEINPADMEPGHGYQIRTTNQPPKTFVLAGEADTTAIGIPAVTINGGSPTPSYAGYSWRDPRELTVNRLNLLASGFTGGTIQTSDRIVGGSLYAYYRTSDNTWQGTLPTITPGKSYYIVSKHNPGWTYTYNASGAALTLPTKGDDANIMIQTPVKTTKTVKTTSHSATN